MKLRFREKSPAVCAILIATLMTAVSPVVFWGCTSEIVQSGESSDAYPRKITVKQAYEKREAGVFFLDVREKCEWEKSHIPGATQIPLVLLQKRINEIPRDREIVVICHSGRRSLLGMEIIRRAGFEKSSSMIGGIDAWQAAGYPLIGTEVSSN
jgi:rhodanese-related sulfurtransferase